MGRQDPMRTLSLSESEKMPRGNWVCSSLGRDWWGSKALGRRMRGLKERQKQDLLETIDRTSDGSERLGTQEA